MQGGLGREASASSFFSKFICVCPRGPNYQPSIANCIPPATILLLLQVAETFEFDLASLPAAGAEPPLLLPRKLADVARLDT